MVGSIPSRAGAARVRSDVLQQRCDLLRSLHVPGTPLVLPNAWDVVSAAEVVAAGFPVVATSSGAVAATMGYEDDQRAPVDEMLAAAARIARSVDVPVTVDTEAGYGMTPGDLADALARVGAAGCNLEDTDHATGRLMPPDRHAAWLAKVREEATARGYGLVINARVDVFLSDRSTPPQPALLDEAIARARSYLAAGADCVFPIFLSDPEATARFVKAVQAPVNILATPDAPGIGQLAELGVARVSFGSFLQSRTAQELARLLADIKRTVPRSAAGGEGPGEARTMR